MTATAEPVAGTGLLALPYSWQDPPCLQQWNTVILDELVAHPQWYARPTSPEQRRLEGAAILTDQSSPKWGVWRETTLVGMFYMTRLVPEVDANLHFIFFDRNLVGKRSLLRRFIDYCFAPPPNGMGLRRASMEVPEDADKLLRFVRKLGFKYEGEPRASGLAPTAFLQAGALGLPPIGDAATWVAKQGARVEGVFWRDDRWIDVLRLRLLRTEWGIEPDATARDRSRSSPDRRGTRWEGHRSRPVHHDTPASG